MHLTSLSKGHSVAFAQTDQSVLKSELMVAIMQAGISIVPLVTQLKDQQA